VHSCVELDAAHEIGAEIVGINNRDLTTLAVDVGRTYELLPDVRDGALVVAESGFHEHGQLEQLEAAGVDAVLIGEALMRAEDIEAATRDLLGSNG
jgi:indole-3-glycerol phosphate synthase